MTIHFGDADRKIKPVKGNARRRVAVMVTVELGATGSLMLPAELPVTPNRGTRDHAGKGGRGDRI